MADRPDDTLRDGNISAAIWGQDYEKKDGEEGRLFNVRLSRSYQDRDGNWKETSHFASNEMLRVSRLSAQAYDRAQELRQEWLQSRNEKPAPRRERERDR